MQSQIDREGPVSHAETGRDCCGDEKCSSQTGSHLYDVVCMRLSLSRPVHAADQEHPNPSPNGWSGTSSASPTKSPGSCGGRPAASAGNHGTSCSSRHQRPGAPGGLRVITSSPTKSKIIAKGHRFVSGRWREARLISYLSSLSEVWKSSVRFCLALLYSHIWRVLCSEVDPKSNIGSAGGTAIGAGGKPSWYDPKRQPIFPMPKR